MTTDLKELLEIEREKSDERRVPSPTEKMMREKPQNRISLSREKTDLKAEEEQK